MGCWNSTCGLTQMPIKSGEKVVLFPLLKNKYADNGGCGFCYSYNQYSPISIPLFGKYDDYGTIEEITNNKEFIFNFFQKLIESNTFTVDEREHKRQKSINSDYTGTPRTMEELIEVYMREPVYEGFGFMLIHENLYHKVINEIGSRKSYGETKTLKECYLEEGQNFLKEYKEIKEKEKEYEEKLQELREKRKEEPDNNELTNQFFEIFGMMKVIDGDLCNHFYKNEFVRFFDSSRPNAWNFKRILSELIKESEEEQEKIVKEIVDLILFDYGFSLMRKTWSPQCGAGSQSAEYYLHKLLAEEIIKKEQSVIDEWFEENEADEEEDIEFGKNITKE